MLWLTLHKERYLCFPSLVREMDDDSGIQLLVDGEGVVQVEVLDVGDNFG